MSYSLNIYLNYIRNKTVDDKDLPWMSGWNKNCTIKWKNNAYCQKYVRSGGTLFEPPPKLCHEPVAELTAPQDTHLHFTTFNISIFVQKREISKTA